ncbi:sestrin-2-like isoform X2 [Eriocheir sinensis]|uniref:sestrin-2-like isoform X2 n=1 Tax=Eriocheir sinensis TaxID=95602 RepID=UPI0021C65261|nr:sestrin-2-like isoform X2 [Eriocheir sinensis]
MGHLVEQSEVTAIETQVSKVTSTTVTSSAPHQSELRHLTVQSQQGQGEGHRQQQQGQQQQQQQQQAAAAAIAEEAAGDKREKSEDDGPEEEENGWWAERVVGALGGLGGDYGDTWYRSHAHLLHGDGPLPHTWRLYIAALAVCRHEVGWLMHALLTDFRNAGGDIRWMAGVHLAPPKLYALVSINNLLAHRPWLLLPQHIQQLTKGEESWSLGELCQALCIMTHFHALSSFLHGSGLSTLPVRSKKNEGGAMTREGGNSSKGTAGCLQNQKGCPESNANANCSRKTRTDIKNAVPVGGVQHRVRTYAHLTLNPTLMYEDFNGNDESCIPSFSVHEYNWQDHGYAMCSRLLGEVGAFLDERFTSALSATHTLPQKQLPGKATVNQQPSNMSESAHCDKAPAKTMPIPTKALWNYVQWLLGIQHDDCDYALLNKHLDPQVKAFVKAACCYPETLEDAGSRPAAISGIVPSLVETSVVVMEARLQSELLYALRAIMLHQC